MTSTHAPELGTRNSELEVRMPGEFAEFEAGEYEARWAAARAAMAEAGIDALFISSECNYRYLSGHVTPFWVSKSRPMFFLLPLSAAPILFVTNSQIPTVRATSPVADVRAWEGFVGPGIDLLEGALTELGLTAGRIGAELGEEQRLGLPYADFVDLQDRLPRSAFVDAAELLWGLRVVKSPAEIAYLRRSAEIASAAYRELFAAVRPGMSEHEVFAAFVASTIRQGAERPGYVPIHSGAGHYRRVSMGPTGRRLAPGDLLWLDGGCVYRGYWSDFARMVAIGRPTAAQQDRYRLVRSIMHECVAAIRPGATMPELTARARRAFAAAGLEFSSHSRIGHGLGLDITEPPSINASDETVVRPGMVLTMEPASATDDGFFQLEENLVVTEDGCEILTEPAPAELPVID
jgi:Xaa-Pro aminopeptidase